MTIQGTTAFRMQSRFSGTAGNIASNMRSSSDLLRNYSKLSYGHLYVGAKPKGGQSITDLPSRYQSRFHNNGANMKYCSRSAGFIPTSSGSYTQQVTMGPTNSFMAGNTIGTLANLAMQIAPQLLSKSTPSTPQTNSQTLTDRMQSAFGGSYTPTANTGELGSGGMPSASSYGAQFATTYSSVEAYMKSDTMEPGALRTSANNLVSMAYSDVNTAEANFNVLKGRQADAMANQTKLQSNLTKAEGDQKAAKSAVGERQSVLKDAKNNRARADAELSEKDQGYKTACTDLSAKETAKDQKQAEVSSCTQEVATAKASLTQATANKNSAQQALNNVNSNPNATAAQKTAAQNALAQAEQAEAEAKQKLDEAQQKLDKAKEELTKAEQEVDQARASKEEALKALETAKPELANAIKACRDAEANVERAQNQFDSANKILDTCNSTYTEAKAAMEDASGVIAQCNEYNARMGTLKDNLVKATKLQEQANKKADQYEKKHPTETTPRTETPTS